MSNRACTILKHDLSAQAAFDDKVEFCGSRVDMRSVETARAKETENHGAAGADERREGGVICANSAASQALRDRVYAFGIGGRWGVEVEDVGVVIGEKFAAF